MHVFVLDTGVAASLPEFAGRIGEGFDAFGQGYTGDCQYTSHGTEMAGLIAGTTAGVAKKAIIHPVRVNNCQQATMAELIAGINWAAGTNYRPAVLNISQSAGYTSVYRDIPMANVMSQNTAPKSALSNAKSRGITIVAAAGNDGGDSCSEIIAGSVWYIGGVVVSGTDGVDALAGIDQESGSTGGACTTINAPWFGRSVWKDPSQFQYANIEGSSVSAALVSGAVVLIKGAYPNIDSLLDSTNGLYQNATILPLQKAGSRFSYIAPSGMRPNSNRFLYTKYITDPPPPPPVIGNPIPICGRRGPGGRC